MVLYLTFGRGFKSHRLHHLSSQLTGDFISIWEYLFKFEFSGSNRYNLAIYYGKKNILVLISTKLYYPLYFNTSMCTIFFRDIRFGKNRNYSLCT